MPAAYGAGVDRRAFIVVAAGGVAGAATRWLTGEIVDDAVVALLLVNTVGTALLGAVSHGVLHSHPTRNLLLGIGFCGGLTTFSTFALHVAVRLDQGRVVDGLGVTGFSLLLGIVAFAAGRRTRRLAR